MMPLQFNGYPILDPSQYQTPPRPSFQEAVSNPIFQGLQALANEADKKKQETRQNELLDMQRQEFRSKYGSPLPPAPIFGNPGNGLTPDAQMRTQMGGRDYSQPPSFQGQPIGQESLVTKFHRWNAQQGQAKNSALSDFGISPDSLNALGIDLSQRSLGTEQLGTLTKLADERRKMGDERRKDLLNASEVNKNNADAEFLGSGKGGSNKTTMKIIDGFNKDANVVKTQQSLNAANNVRALVTSGNPIGANAIPTYMARMSGEVGNLSEADKRPFGGSQQILARLQAAFQQASTGQMTPENKQYVLGLADAIDRTAKGNLDLMARNRARQYSNAGIGLSEDSVYRMLMPSGGEGGNYPGTPSPVAKPHSDSAAVEWARSHPGDPRATKILQLNGVVY